MPDDEAAQAEEPDGIQLDDDVDPALVQFVQLIELGSRSEGNEQFGLPLTLVIGGSVISGMVTAGRIWWKEFADAMRSASPMPSGSNTAEDAAALGGLVADFFDPFSQVYSEDRPLPPRIRYMHLRDARILHPDGTLPTNSGVLFRVSLSDVEAWTLGKMVAEAGD